LRETGQTTNSSHRFIASKSKEGIRMTVKVIQDFWKNAIVFNESARGKGENLQGCWVEIEGAQRGKDI
jgi:hypothetical protein